MSDLYERSAAVMPPFALHKMPFGIDHASGSYLYTDDGRKILDFGSGIAVNNLGHNYPTVVKAAHEQLDKMVHCCHNLFHYEKETALAERIVGLMGGGYKVYFSNSGAEAVEGAVKLAKYATERPAIIAFKGSFHGRTMMCTSLTASNSAYRKHYEGLVPSIYFAEYPKLFGTPYKMEDGKCPKQYFTQFDDIFKRLVDPYSVAAILMEPVQGEGGVHPATQEFMTGLREFCDENGMLLLIDEVQTGWCRTGAVMSYMNYGIKPDIVSMAKGLGGGMPIGAICATEEVAKAFTPGSHGTTFGGHPVSCAAAYAEVGELLDRDLAGNAKKMGDYFSEKLAKMPHVKEVRHQGLLVGVEFDDAVSGVEVKHACLDRKLLITAIGAHTIRMVPPLIVNEEQCDKAVEIITEAVEAVAK